MVEKLKKIWKNKTKIIEGIWNLWFPSQYVEKIAKHRLAICQSNVCGLYDPIGSDIKCFVPGSGCCSGCGCNDKYKTHSLASYCYLKDIGKEPLWDVEMTEKEEKEFREKTGIKNEV